MDQELYDEFGNYIGPELDSDDDNFDDDDNQEEDAEYVERDVSSKNILFLWYDLYMDFICFVTDFIFKSMIFLES